MKNSNTGGIKFDHLYFHSSSHNAIPTPRKGFISAWVHHTEIGLPFSRTWRFFHFFHVSTFWVQPPPPFQPPPLIFVFGCSLQHCIELMDSFKRASSEEYSVMNIGSLRRSYHGGSSTSRVAPSWEQFLCHHVFHFVL
jgi:hypothetical protein